MQEANLFQKKNIFNENGYLKYERLSPQVAKVVYLKASNFELATLEQFSSLKKIDKLLRNLLIKEVE